MGDHTREGATDERRLEAAGSAQAEGLHPDRTFVVQLRCAPGADGAELVGRVEHVVSGAVVRFRSTAELVEFLERGGSPAGEPPGRVGP